jgi:DNA-binding IclR family transcriptional regulator
MADEAVDSGLYAPAVERALEILEHLARHPSGLTLSDLSAQLELPKNAVFRITNTLRERGYLARDGRTMRFTLTEKLVRVSQPRVEKKGLIELSMEPMRELRDATKETVQIGRRMGKEGVILEAVEALHPLRISVDPGLRFPLYNNAPGKLLLATLPPRERKAMLDDLDLEPCTPRTITDRRELERECQRILDQGYSTDFAEADEGIHCIAAAITDAQGACVGTVWVSAPSKRMPKTSFAEIGRQVRETGNKISERLRNP